MRKMMASSIRVWCVAIALTALTISGAAQSRDRGQTPDKYKWNLAELYASDAAWRAAKDRLASDLQKLRQYQGKVASSAATLADALDLQAAFAKELGRLYTYASLLADQDTRDSSHEGMRQEMNQLAAALGAASSFIEPELLKAGEPSINTFVASEPRLKVYSFYLSDVFRRASHTLSDAEEQLLADVGPLAGNPSSLYNIFANADFPFPTVTLSTGKSVKIDQAAFGELRALPSRADRQKVMSGFFTALGSFGRTFGTSLSGEVLKLQFYSKARKYPSALALQLDGPNIPASVYTRLVDGVNRNLPAFHRYLKLRKQMMKLDQLHYYDLYAPLVSSVDLKYTPGEAQKLVLAAVAPLGTDYQATIGRAFDSRWIDLYPNDGKASGAYSDGGAYYVHPYMLINYNGQYSDVSTLAHELGHTMQSYLSNKTQPFPLAGYPTFVAEVASTFNESLLIDYMLGQIKDDATRLALLGNYLENIKGTVFRQTQFAEFELRMHELAREGKPITGDLLAKLYMDITKKYYGHDQGVCVVVVYVAHELWYNPPYYPDL
jgi:oligoendopeptidase F